MCELKTMHPLNAERTRIDGWTARETMEEIDREREEKERESDA